MATDFGFRARALALARKAEFALLQPVDIAWLVAFRIAYGLTLCVSMLRFLWYGWVETLFVRPSFHFKYWGFAWVESLPSRALHGLFALLAALAFAVALGVLHRLALGLFLLGFSYLSLLDVSNYLNHYYLAGLLGLLLLVAPSGRAGSVDVQLSALRRRSWVPAAYLYLFRFQVAVVYTFAGLAKVHEDWLLYGQPLGIWLAARTDLPLLGRWFAVEPVPLLMSWAGCLFDCTICVWLSWSKTRHLAFVAVLLFHLTTRILFPIGMFPVIMVVSALVFFPPDWPRRVLERVGVPRSAWRSALPQSLADGQGRRLGLTRWGIAGLVFAGIYCAFQLALPLRYLAYGGDVRWHEQGMRFSWRVMVREKNGSVTFLVRNKATGRRWQVNPRRYLTHLQEREMSAQPDLILQLAHHVARDFEQRGSGPVEVRVDALASLNGRRSWRLIDPELDLSQVSDGVSRADWVLPAPSEPPPRIKPIRATARR